MYAYTVFIFLPVLRMYFAATNCESRKHMLLITVPMSLTWTSLSVICVKKLMIRGYSGKNAHIL